MARILLGVSGGIAAYKALELARLATRAGHGVRVLMTPAADAVRRRRVVRGHRRRAGPGRRVRARPDARRVPRRSGARPRPDRPPRARRATPTCYLVAPASANTIAKLAAGIADSMLTTSFLACTAPRAVAPAMNDRMYARRRDAGEPRDAARRAAITVIEPEEGALASRGEHGVGRLPLARARCSRGRGAAAAAPRAVGRPAGPGDGGRHPGADRLGALHRQPLQRPHGLRAGRARGAARRRRDAGRRERRARRARRRARGSTSRPPRSSRPPCERSFRDCRRPADGGRGGRLPPARAAGGKARARAATALDAARSSATEDILAGGSRAPRATARRSSASRPSTAPEAIERAREQARAQGPRRDRLQRRLAGRDRLRLRATTRSTIVEPRRASTGAARVQGARSPTRSSTASRRCLRRPARRLQATCTRAAPHCGAGETLYDLYQRGMSLLESGDFAQADRAPREGGAASRRRRARFARRWGAPTSATRRYRGGGARSSRRSSSAIR